MKILRSNGPRIRFNPWIGCSKVHTGCTFCYAEADQDTFRGRVKWGIHGTRSRTAASTWKNPFKWNRQSHPWRPMTMRDGSKACADCDSPPHLHDRPRVFCSSLADVFEDWQGPMINKAGDVLMVCQNGHIDGWTWDGTPHEIDCSNECGEMMRPMTMDDCRRDLFELIDATPNLDWLLLTKRPENARRMWLDRMPGDADQIVNYHLTTSGLWPDFEGEHKEYRPNAWIGTSVSDQETADKAIPELLKLRDLTPCLFLSIEPLVGPVGDLFPYLGEQRWHCDRCQRDKSPLQVTYEEHCSFCGEQVEWIGGVDWVIVGGESGSKSRPCNVDWIRDIRNQCADAGVPCFIKQLGQKVVDDNASNQSCSFPEEVCWPDSVCKRHDLGMKFMPLKHLKGGDESEWPIDLRVREVPQLQVAR